MVDFFHVCEHLSKLAQLFFQDPSDAEVWYKKYRTMLKEDPEGASKLIRAARYRRSITKKSQIEAEIKYLQHNRKRMNYFQLRHYHLLSEVGVEAACKNLIGARMKKSGMRWTLEGGTNYSHPSFFDFKQSLGGILGSLHKPSFSRDPNVISGVHPLWKR